VKIFNKKAAVM